MSCYHPLHAWAVPDPSTGKKKIKFMSSPLEPSVGKKRSAFDSYEVMIPCGQCIGCRMDYAHDWTNRLLLEMQSYKSEDCHFVTLTYDSEHIEKRCFPATWNDTGEVCEGFWSLNKRDLQLFMKRLRKALPDQRIRFYACGEYGGKNGRPHYHIILFGCCLPECDLQSIGRSQIGNNYFTSKLLSLAWPFGFNLVAAVTPESIGYTCRYMLKKQKGDDAFVYSDYNIEAPFSLCSRKPGLGYEYYRSHPEIFDNGLGRITIGTPKGSKSFYPPKYFVRLLEQDRPELAKDYKERKQEDVIERQRLELLSTDLDRLEYLAVKESEALRKGNTLNSFRNLV